MTLGRKCLGAILVVGPLALLTLNAGCELSGPLDIGIQLESLGGLLGRNSNDASSGSNDDGLLHDANDDHGGNGNDDGPLHDANDDNGQGNGADDGSTNGANPSPGNVTAARLEARLTGTGVASGSADYRNIGGRQRLKIEIEDAAPASVLSVIVDGIDVGTLTVNSFGTAEVEFDTIIEIGHVAWPAELPKILTAGMLIEIGGVSGQLAISAK